MYLKVSYKAHGEQQNGLPPMFYIWPKYNIQWERLETVKDSISKFYYKKREVTNFNTTIILSIYLYIYIP